MKLLEAIEDARVKHGPRCAVGLLLATLPKPEAADLQTCLDDQRYQHAQIARGLHHIGHKIDQGTIGRHRHGECSC